MASDAFGCRRRPTFDGSAIAGAVDGGDFSGGRASTVVATDGNDLAMLHVAVSGPQSFEVALLAGVSAQAQADAVVTLHDPMAILRLLGGRSASEGHAVTPMPWVTRPADFRGRGVVFRFDESARNVLSKPFDNDEVALLPSSFVNDGFRD